MPFHYKIAKSGKKLEETVDDFEDSLRLFLERQSVKQNYRTAGGPHVDILYQKKGLMEKTRLLPGRIILTMYPYGVEVVSNPEIPADFLQNWGEVIEGPREVTKAEYKFELAINRMELKRLRVFHTIDYFQKLFPNLIHSERGDCGYSFPIVAVDGNEGIIRGSVEEILNIHNELQRLQKMYSFKLENYSAVFE